MAIKSCVGWNEILRKGLLVRPKTNNAAGSDEQLGGELMERNGADKGAARLRTLVVEDDALIAMDTEDALVQAGCEVVGVADRCQTAVELIRAERPDLVVMDISLAGERDGVEAATLIRNLFDIPALFVSGQTSSDLVPRASEAKAVGWLSKPLDRRKLVNAIDKARRRAA